ncbi:MAG: metal-dependent hydrolase [Chloroflexi bacterium]|nr:metal-dependent hydrolase [Chloroflexota bacterium]
MLPSAHVEFTWAAANALQRSRHGTAQQDLDYRLLALAALLPDLIDKPLAVFALRDSKAALLYGHTLLLHLAVWGGATATGRLRRWWPYLLAFSGHLAADRMWGFAHTLLWPLRGRQFHQWKDVGSPEAFLRAYADIIRSEPKLVALEAVGLALLVGVIADRKLYRKSVLSRFLRTGKVE